MPLGIWVRMVKYKSAPFRKTLKRADAALTPTVTESLVFVEPSSSKPFIFRGHRITRTGFHLSHGKVITSTACQGRTFKAGVIIDCGRLTVGNYPKSDDDWWLELYVMLSRATRLEDVLLIRPPDDAFLLAGPPQTIRCQLKLFADRTRKCREIALRLAGELGMSEFLH